LDYLVEDPIPAVILAGGGVLTTVPGPARFAVHKLLVSQRRGTHEAAKKRKDLMQAEQVFSVLLESEPESVSEAYHDCAERGPSWRKGIEKGMHQLPDELRRAIKAAAQG